MSLFLKSLHVALRLMLVWWLPCIVGLLVMLSAFLAWALGTQAGASLLLRTVVAQLDGDVQGVRGSVLNGLSVQRLQVALPDLTLTAQGLHVQINWRALSLRTLHVRDFSLDALHVERTTSEAEVSTAAPALPLKVLVDNVALARFTLIQNRTALPVSLGDLVANGRWDETGLTLTFHQLSLAHEQTHVLLSGDARLTEVKAPWPMQVALTAAVRGAPNSPVCSALRLPNDKLNASAIPDSKPCALQGELKAHGSLADITLTARAESDEVNALLRAELSPTATLPVRQAYLDIALSNESTLAVSLQTQPLGETPSTPLRERLSGTLSARRFNLGVLLPDPLPAATLTAQSRFDLVVKDRNVVTDAQVVLDIAADSTWNGHALSGKVAAHITDTNDSASWTEWRIARLDTDVSLGKNRLHTQGSWGDAKASLTLDMQAPRLSDIWPALSGNLSAQGRLRGDAAKHDAELTLRYAPNTTSSQTLGKAPINVKLSLDGTWRDGWLGRLRALHATHVGVTAAVSRPIPIAWQADEQASARQWQIGAGRIAVNFPGDHTAMIAHQKTRFSPGRWESTAGVDEIMLTRSLAREIRKLLDPNYHPSQKSEDVSTPPGEQTQRGIGLALDWNLRFDGTLAGTARLTRRSGDLRIPGDPPTPLGLRELSLTLNATPTRSSGASRLDIALAVLTEKMGQLRGTATTTLQGLTLAPQQAIRTTLTADIDDLGWISLLTGDGFDLGGRLSARLQGQGSLEGAWVSNGIIQGDKLRVVRIDDGVRLLDGTLAMRLARDKVVLESLRFPAVRRITPSEWRTRTWIAEEADAQNGELRASGEWNLTTMAGDMQIALHRFPVVQRADRYAMMTGQLDLTAKLPALCLSGTLTADAGWVNPEVNASVPTLDDDVTVRRANDSVATPSGVDASLDVSIDLGPRFYVVGMGINAGLVGRLQVTLDHKRLSGLGAFRTRGGRFEAYGQRLQLRRGVINFHDNLANPRLDIEALRLGEQVEAGVRVSGTAQRPRIDLVSYPDVSDVDKLSWLILGRGADQSGSDAALLVSLGTTLFGGGEPLYRRFGLDDVGIKTGVMGSSGSLLPDTTVAGSVSRPSNAELETQFMVASKRFADVITLSIEQALAGAQTVGRASYQLARGLSLDVKGGSVNGLALVYRTLWGN